jgi:hypothetical protein
MSVKSVVKMNVQLHVGRAYIKFWWNKNSETGYINLMDDVAVPYAWKHLLETRMG